jgi:hypothetical protein
VCNLLSLTQSLYFAELNTKGCTDMSSVFLCCLSESRELLPDAELLLQAAEKINPANRKPVHMMLLLLMMAYSVAKRPTPAISQQILDVSVSYFEKCQVEMCDRSAASRVEMCYIIVILLRSTVSSRQTLI